MAVVLDFESGVNVALILIVIIQALDLEPGIRQTSGRHNNIDVCPANKQDQQQQVPGYICTGYVKVDIFSAMSMPWGHYSITGISLRYVDVCKVCTGIYMVLLVPYDAYHPIYQHDDTSHILM